MSLQMWPEEDLKHFKRQKNIFRASKKSIWGPKMANFLELLGKFGHLRSFQAGELIWRTIFMVYFMENVARGGFESF